jgi:hypothetical protein
MLRLRARRKLMSTARPNWYPDPEHPGFLRYWDGNDWTGDLVPASASDVAAHTPPGVAPVPKVPIFGARAHAKRQSQDLAAALAENQRLRAELASFGGLEVVELQRRREQGAAQITSELARLDSMRTQVINTEENRFSRRSVSTATVIRCRMLSLTAPHLGNYRARSSPLRRVKMERSKHS